MDDISLLIHKTSISREIESFSENLTWILRNYNHPNVDINAVNIISDHIAEIVLADNKTFKVNYQSASDLLDQVVSKVASITKQRAELL